MAERFILAKTLPTPAFVAPPAAKDHVTVGETASGSGYVPISGHPGYAMNATTISMPDGGTFEKNMLSSDNAEMRATMPDPLGHAGVHPDPTEPFGADFIAELAERVRKFNSQPWYVFGMGVGGLTGIRNIVASGEAGGLDTITSSLIGLDEVLKSGKLLATSQKPELGSAATANRVAVQREDQEEADKRISGAERATARRLAGLQAPAATGLTANLANVPPGLIPAVTPSLNPRSHATSRDELIRSYMKAGKLTKDVLEAAVTLFPKEEPLATSLKFNFASIISGFGMLNITIVSAANVVAQWMFDELVDPKKGTSRFIADLQTLNAPLLVLFHQTRMIRFTALVINENSPRNGLPLSEVVLNSVSQELANTAGRMLSDLTQGVITQQKTRGFAALNANPKYKDKQRPWLFD
jgi:hypothetical protein